MCCSSAAKDDFDYKNKIRKHLITATFVKQPTKEFGFVLRMIFIILIISNVVRWSEMLEEPATPSTEKLDA